MVMLKISNICGDNERSHYTAAKRDEFMIDLQKVAETVAFQMKWNLNIVRVITGAIKH